MKFFHRIHGAKFHMPDGRELSFAGGVVDTDTIPDPATRSVVELELKKVANVPASMIFTQQVVADSSEAAVAAEVKRTAEASFDGDKKIPGGAVTVGIAGGAGSSKGEVNPLNPKAAAGQIGSETAAALQRAKDAVAAHHKPATPAPVVKQS